ncbi:transcriptional regulator [Mycolicibacter sinensis]|uniref:Transcriptional regulator n=2 Tax=Mycolicibacter sinensis (strain JDM601) TaxID=875328 RepID=F5YRR0_MYCSD|nr:transcriptional regulator [Mycolicibacter sinensis]
MLSGTTIGDVWDARLTIEPPAVRRLAETATKSTIKELDAELESIRSVIDDPREFGKAGVRFHVRLVELSGNHTLAAVIGMLSVIIERELAKSLVEIGVDSDEVRRANRRALRGYDKVVELIRERDGEAAEAAWREHMNSARRYVAKTQKQDRVIDLLY